MTLLINDDVAATHSASRERQSLLRMSAGRACARAAIILLIYGLNMCRQVLFVKITVTQIAIYLWLIVPALILLLEARQDLFFFV